MTTKHARLRDDLRHALAAHHHALTPALGRDLGLALKAYREQPEQDLTDEQWARRCAAMAKAHAAALQLLRALDVMDRAWDQSAPNPRRGRRSRFINDGHGDLRAEALARERAWREWLTLRHSPREAHRPRDGRRHKLGLDVVWALMGAGIPLAVRRPTDPVQDVLCVIFATADRLDGVTPRPRDDLFRTARRFVTIARAIDATVRAGRDRPGLRVIEVPRSR